ncbi:cytochrome c-type biogenesis protein CcmH [Chloroflexota bacterium]
MLFNWQYSIPSLASDIRSISEGLNCVCGGCDDILSECSCETAGELTTQIREDLSRGHSEEQIVQDFVQQYGQRVLVEKSHS